MIKTHSAAVQNIKQKEKLSSLVPISQEMIPLLSRLLQRQDIEDPFLFSPTYLLMTGRKGLWIYGDDQAGMLIARHPNRSDTILFFLPFGKDQDHIIGQAMNDPALPKGKIQIVRIPESRLEFIKGISIHHRLEVAQEDVLDWVYPVHALSVHQVLNHSGPSFRIFRNRLAHAQCIPSRTEKINPDTHYNDIIKIVTRWATDGRKEGFTFDDLVGPTKFVLDLMRNKNLNINGVIVYHNDQPSSYMLWETLCNNPKAVVAQVRVSIGHMDGLKGTAEYGMLKVMEALAEQGVDYMYLGGSETKSLDTFKRKLGPIKSLNLQTAVVRV